MDGLTQSLQAKHEESSFLQLQLAEVQQSLDLIQASWQGDLVEVQVSRWRGRGRGRVLRCSRAWT